MYGSTLKLHVVMFLGHQQLWEPSNLKNMHRKLRILFPLLSWIGFLRYYQEEQRHGFLSLENARDFQSLRNL
ncbi:Uncharacterised protein [Chlamydia abortus]|nr:Uncharacterised protein [Chlamydia abortus]